MLKDATHFAFSNSVCGQTQLYRAVRTRSKVNAICRYGLAFFERYLRANLSASEQLGTSDSALVYYTKEEEDGESLEWGSEPASSGGGLGGIVRELWRDRQK